MVMVRSPATPTRRAGFALAALLGALLLLEATSRLIEWSAGTRAVAVTPAPCLARHPSTCRELATAEDHPTVELQNATFLVRHPRRRWTLRANAPPGRYPGNLKVRTNALGLRGPALPPRRPPEQRLMVLGDSSVFGEGVHEQETRVVVAARRLARAWGRAVTPINGGVPGYDSGQSLALLQEMAPALRPTHVVICNIWSDLYMADRSQNLQVDRAGPALPLRHLALYRLAYRVVTPWLRPVKVGFITSRQDIGGAARPTRVPLATYAANLDRMARVALAQRARPVFLLLPAPMDFAGAALPETVADFREAMRQVAARHKAVVVDGPARLRKVANPGGLFFDAVHPDARGNRLLGEMLADALLGRGGQR